MTIKSYLRDYDVSFEKTIDVSPYADKNSFFVVDNNVFRLYESAFSQIDKKALFVFDAAEHNKNLDSAMEICRRITGISAKKNALLISAGGGITQDVTGFVAHILYRGIRWVYFPTTLLAACDSCIGSKTSLNFEGHKNLLGTFYPPEKIIIVPDCFKTLSRYDVASGLGEIVKFNIMRGEKAIGALEKDLPKLIALDEKTVKNYINNSLAFKKEYIEADEFDKKERVMLNFAHTFGHAIETASGYKIPHGTAVAMGITGANFISYKKGMLGLSLHNRIIELVKNIVAVDTGCINLNDIIKAVKNDKKQISDKIRVILLDNDFNLSINYISENELFEAFNFIKEAFTRRS